MSRKRSRDTAQTEAPTRAARKHFAKPSDWTWAAPFVVFGAACLVFARTLTHGFVDWDDILNIHMNPAVMYPTPQRLVDMWTRPYAELFIPLVYSSYLVDVLIGGGHAWTFHATNVLLHAASSLFVFRILRNVGCTTASAMFGALLFAVHPVQAEPVSWVTGRKDVLSGACVLAAVWLFDIWMTRGGAWRVALATLLFAAALAAKPSAVITPLLALALTVYRMNRRSATLAVLAGWFVMSIAWTLLTFKAQIGMEDAPFLLPLWKRPFAAADAVLFYVGKIVWPVGLAPIYAHTTQSVFASPLVWLKLPVVLAAAAVVLWLRGRALLAAAFFVFPLLPVLGFTPFIFQFHSTVADRYAYLSFLGAGLALALVMQWADTLPQNTRRASYTAAAVAMLLLAAIAFRTSGYWEEAETLWKRELAIDPANPNAHYNLGTTYAESERWEEARTEFEKVLELDPKFAKAFTNLMLMAHNSGKPQDAIQTARRTLASFPQHDGRTTATVGNVEEFVAVGNAFLNLNQYDKAAWAFRGAIQGDPNDADSLNNLGTCMMRMNDAPNAIKAFEGVLVLSPMNVRAHGNLGVAYMQTGNLEKAKAHLETVLQISPQDARARELLQKLTAREATPASGPR